MATNGGSSSSNPTRTVTFRTSDSKKVEVPVEIAQKFGTVRELFDAELDRPEGLSAILSSPPEAYTLVYPLPEVDSFTLHIMVEFHSLLSPVRWEYQALKKERLDLPLKYEALETERALLPLKYQAWERERALLPSKYEALEIERALLASKYEALKKKWQELDKFFGGQSDETIVELVKAADFLEDEELLDSVMRSYRMRFGLGDDKGVDFVYTAEAEAILLRRAASASGGAGS